MEANTLISLPTVCKEQPPLLLNFPVEIHYNVLECADVSQYSTLRLVCKKWYNFIEHSLPLSRYVPAKIEFKNAPLERPKELPSLGLCMDSSLWLVHRGVFIFSKFRMDPKLLNLDRITTGVDFVNSPVTNRIREPEASEEAIDTSLARCFVGYNGPEPGTSPGLFCGNRNISHYLSDPAYIVDPSHPEYGKYNRHVEVWQYWKLVPGPQMYDLAAQPCATLGK
ncbi:uncharacterized protein DFL_008285 [Arthrobotrys flagrans]|uniref:F-box domain-containing protein n=1 Tax=Arthrobotrys flagrans TaxID=97331 RepID=A0A436ZNA2_ARTFL|nr:hypothetical protein DFL_008285 [Arthrobotrys flagrans]